MKTIKFFMMAALALLTAACSNKDDIALQPAPEQSAAGENIIITATISTGEAGTRSLAENTDGKLKTTIGVGENLAVLLQGSYDLTINEYETAGYGFPLDEETGKIPATGPLMSKAEVKAVDSETGKITIEFSIPASTVHNTDCIIVYPVSAANVTLTGAELDYSLLYQDGTLTNAPDVRVGEAKINMTSKQLVPTSGSDPISLDARNAIVKFNLGGTKISAGNMLFISQGDDIKSIVMPKAEIATGNPIYVSMPGGATGNYQFTLFEGGYEWSKTKIISSSIAAGKYYRGTVSGSEYPGIELTLEQGSAVSAGKALSQATPSDVGKLVGENGLFYDSKAAMGVVVPVGVIAYVASDASDNFSEDGRSVNIIESGGSRAASETTFSGKGLVLCLKEAGDAKWADTNPSAWDSNIKDQQYAINKDASEWNKTDEYVSGYTITKNLASVAEAATKYPAAYTAWNYNGLKAPAGTTGWFLPSAQQWKKIVESLGGIDSSASYPGLGTRFGFEGIGKLEAAFAQAGTGNYDSMKYGIYIFWTISPYYNGSYYDGAVILNVNPYTNSSRRGFYWQYMDKDGSARIRPVFAF